MASNARIAMTLLAGTHTRLRRLRWRVRGAMLRARTGRLALGKNVQVSSRAILSTGRAAGERIAIGGDSEIHTGAILATYGGFIELGHHCSVNPYSVLYGHGGLTIGNYVRIAAHCVIIPANHRFRDPELPIAVQGIEQVGITIQDNVWIGANVTVLDGCTIGSGSVVAAGTVVTKDVPSEQHLRGQPGPRRRATRGQLAACGGTRAPHHA